MFESLIEEIFLDNCGQMEKVNRSKKLVRLQAKSCEQYDRLFAVLDDEHKDWLEKVWDADVARETENIFLHFRAGLKFGLLLTIEALGYRREEDVQN